MSLIAVTGFKGSGKSEVSKCLVKQGYVRVSFGDPLKNMLKAIGLTDEHLFGSLKEVPTDILCNETPRYAMQSLGTEWGRLLIHDRIWTNLWWKTVRDILAAGGNVVTDDLRYPNEAEIVRRKGGKIWKIHRMGYKGDLHSSEVLIDSIRPDTIIGNNGTIESFHERILELEKFTTTEQEE
jgi:hypothetical protein